MTTYEQQRKKMEQDTQRSSWKQTNCSVCSKEVPRGLKLVSRVYTRHQAQTRQAATYRPSVQLIVLYVDISLTGRTFATGDGVGSLEINRIMEKFSPTFILKLRLDFKSENSIYLFTYTPVGIQLFCPPLVWYVLLFLLLLLSINLWSICFHWAHVVLWHCC